jgi:hypothetical protein
LSALALAGEQGEDDARRAAAAHGRHAASVFCRGGQRARRAREEEGGRGRGPGRLRRAGAREAGWAGRIRERAGKRGRGLLRQNSIFLIFQILFQM